MFYSDEIIEEVRARNDIVDIVSSYVKLKKKGSGYFGLCPFHNEKSPSFSVSQNKQLYYCFGCGAGGNVLSFLMQYENYSFQEAMKYLADRAGISLPDIEYSKEDRRENDLKSKLYEINKLAANYFYYQLNRENGKMAFDYLTKRGLNKETMVKFGLGYSNKFSDDLYKYLKSKDYMDEVLKESGLVTIEERGSRDKFWNRVMFPILDINNKVIGFGGRVMGDGMPKYLNSPETKLFDKSKNLYALNFARHSRKDYFLLCEGYMDVIALHQAGFDNAIASLGTAFTQNHSLLIKRYVKKVIITFDSDNAGVNAAKRAIPILKLAGLSVKILDMKPYKDPDEFIKALGSEEFALRIKNAKNSFIWEIDILKQDFDISDPDSKTGFHREIANRLTQFSDPLERENYMQTVCERYYIKYDDMKRLVNNIGYSRSTAKEDRASAHREDRQTIKKAKDDGINKSQRLILTWLVEDNSLFEKIKPYIQMEDFINPLYQETAKEIFSRYERGTLNPASIIDMYIGDEEKQKEVARIFNTNLGNVSLEERNKAIVDSIIKMKQARLDMESSMARDLSSLQEIIKKQNELKNLKINI